MTAVKATARKAAAAVTPPPASAHATGIQTPTQHYAELAVKVLDPHPDNPRSTIGDLDELMDSIRAVGMLEPLVVAPRPKGRFQVIAGHRRLAAAQALRLDEVSCVVREDLVEQAGRLAMLIENLQRRDLDELDEARGYQGLVDLGLTQSEIATKVGRSQSHVSKRLALVGLPKKAQAALASRTITVADALELAKLPDEPRVNAVLANYKPGTWQTIDRLVRGHLEAIQRDEWVAEQTKKLEATGVTIVEPGDLGKRNGDYYRHEVRKGSYSGVDMDPRKHAKLDCHAVWLDSSMERVVPCCRTPRVHKPQSEAAGGAAVTAETQQRRDMKEIKAAFAARAQFLRQLVTGALPPPERAALQQQILIAYAVGRMYVDRKDVAKLTLAILGIDEKPEHATNWPDVMSRHVATCAGDAGPVAVAIATLEAQLQANHVTRWDGERRAYLELLERHGYRPVEVEHRRVGRVQSSAGEWVWPNGTPPKGCAECGVSEDDIDPGVAWRNDGLCELCAAEQDEQAEQAAAS